MASVIKCDNPWCATSTRTHKSKFAKRKCDEARGRQAGIETAALRMRKSLSETSTLIGGDVDPVHVSFLDLQDAHLAGVTIENAVLQEAEGTNLSKTTLTKATFEKGVDGVTMEGSQGSDVRVAHSLRSSILDNVLFSKFSLDADALVAKSSFSGARLNDSSWGDSARIEDSSFRWSTLRRAHFSRRLRFVNCDLTGTDFSNSEFRGTQDGAPTFERCEIDLTNFSGINLQDVHFDGVPLAQRVYFVDQDTRPPLEPGGTEPTDEGREFMTRAMTLEQHARYTDSLGISDVELRGALARLSPAFVPVREGGTVGERGELLRRAAQGEDIETLVAVQSEVWVRSSAYNPLLVAHPDAIYSSM